MAEHSNRKWIVLGLAAGLAVLVVIVLANRGQAPAVPVVSVAREDLSATISSNGKVEPITATVARAQFPTFVEKVHASEGQAVHRGQLILTLDAADVRSQLAQARASLLAAQTDLQNARAGGPPDEVVQLQGDLQKAQVTVANLERTQQALEQLVAKQAATQDELAQNQAALAQARANLQILQEKKTTLAQRSTVTVESASLRVRQSQEQVRALEEKVRSATVTAAAEGTLYSLPVHAGDYVKVGDTLAEMADLRHVRVRAFVDEPDLGWLEPNQTVQVNWDAKPGRTWTGHTEMVPKQVVARGTRSVGEVLCSVDNDKLELLPNVNVEVRIMVRTRQGALVIDRSAVRFDSGKHFVFLFDGDKIHRREISVGVASATKYEVVAGLRDGDRVALPGDQDLKDGMDVRAAEGK
ncbi:MAG TPA: efflux RND transporter periplasmic adaptor subunit [Candidatus Limnocylindria bacterium]|nr:efflux RND transporter periplasmic adaptor subunit [Candidatus Limnocylindria bacterium]